MTRRRLSLLLFLSVGIMARAAEGPESGDARLREALRSVTLQLRAAETERASLQAAQTTLTAEKKAAEERFEVLRKQTVAERTATDQTLAGLKAQLGARDAELVQLKEALAQAQAAHQQAAALVKTREAERARLATDIVVLERKVADREAKNLALHRIGNEILTRYEKFGLGEVLAAREPFVGATRTRLENLVQDYQDKLADQRVKP